MSDIETKVALEAIKPASGFIQSLLEPKINKVKEWAYEKELEGQIDKKNLPKVMEDYLISLAHQVSEITSIAFPLRKLEIDKIYEPLDLEKLNKEKVNIISLIKEYSRSYIIIDGAGMGKTTFSKYLITQLLFKCDRIPVFFELRKVEDDLLASIAEELDFPGNKFSRSLFYKLLKLGKFILILDGYDEIDRKYLKSCSKQIRDLSIKGGKNTIVLTSRPQDSLPDLINVESYKFSTFTIGQATSLVERYDAISNSTIGKMLIKEFDKVPEKFIESPLLVSLLYRTYGFNKTIADKISAFYDEMYNALYKGHDLINKNCYTRDKISKLDYEDFRRLLRALSYCMTVNKKASFKSHSEAISYIDKACALVSVSPTSASNFFNDLLLSVPLIVKDGSEYKFMHKTIIEYFTAEYLINNNNSKELLKKIFNSKIISYFSVPFDFVYDMNPSLYNSVITKSFTKDVLQIDNSITHKNFRVLNSLLFLREKAVIGLWEKDKYTQQEAQTKENKNISVDMLSMSVYDDKIMNLKFSSGIWVGVNIKGVEYYCAIGCTRNVKQLLKDAWLLVSEEIKFDQTYNQSYSYKLTGDIEVIEINKWHTIDPSLILQIYRYDIIGKMVSKILYNFGGEEPKKHTRVISHSNSLDVLEKLKNESQQEAEINLLLGG